MNDPLLVREWGALAFHARVRDLEEKGYFVRRETYTVIPEMNPETGEVIHLHSIEMLPS